MLLINGSFESIEKVPWATYQQTVGVREGAAKFMNHLRDCSWWPNAWLDDASGSLSSSEIRKHGVLKNARRMGNELTLMVEYNGVTYKAIINPNLSEDFLILLRHILLQHWGQPMDVVENIEID